MKSKKINFKSEKGISFVEVLLSVALLAIIAGPLLGAVTASVWNNVTAKDKTEAVALAERVMEEIKAQGKIDATNPDNISGKDFKLYTGDTDKNLTAYYNIVNIDNTTPGGIIAQATTTGSPERKSYEKKIEAANSADFVLEIDQGSGPADSKVKVTLKQNNGTILGTTVVDVVNERLLLRVIHGNFAISSTNNTSNTLIWMGKVSNTTDVKLRVIYINNLHSSSEKLKIYTTIIPEGTNFNTYVMDDDQLEPAVTFSPKAGSEAECFVTYLDSASYDYSSPINVLYKISVSVKKKNSGSVIYEMTSYVKK